MNENNQHADAKHTPGPWKVRFMREGDPEAGFFVEAKHTHPDAAYGIDILCDGDAYYPWQQRLADAELIARAPALLSEVATLRSKQAELIAENSELKRQNEILYTQQDKPDTSPLTSEEVWKLIETYKKAGWYDDEFVLEIERQAAELDKLRAKVADAISVFEEINKGECVYIENGGMFQDVSEMLKKLKP